MNKFENYKFRLLIILMLLLIIFPLFISYNILEVRSDDNEKLLYQQLARINDEFHVRWTHSVTLQPVIETYKLEGIDRIPIIQMVFDDNGPNLPAHPEEDQIWIIEDGKFIVTNYDRYFTRVPVTIGAKIADHRLIYKDKEIVLKEIYRPGGFVHIGLANKSFYEFFVKEVELWLIKMIYK